MTEKMPQHETESNLEGEIVRLQEDIKRMLDEKVNNAINYEMGSNDPQWSKNEYQKRVKSQLEKVLEELGHGITMPL